MTSSMSDCCQKNFYPNDFYILFQFIKTVFDREKSKYILSVSSVDKISSNANNIKHVIVSVIKFLKAKISKCS